MDFCRGRNSHILRFVLSGRGFILFPPVREYGKAVRIHWWRGPPCDKLRSRHWSSPLPSSWHSTWSKQSLIFLFLVEMALRGASRAHSFRASDFIMFFKRLSQRPSSSWADSVLAMCLHVFAACCLQPLDTLTPVGGTREALLVCRLVSTPKASVTLAVYSPWSTAGKWETEWYTPCQVYLARIYIGSLSARCK